MTTVVAAAPRVIGTAELLRVLGTHRRQTVYDRLHRGDDPLLSNGYLGKIAGRHAWNAHILLSGMFASITDLDEFLDGGQPTVAAVCDAAGCTYPANYRGGLCYRHFGRLLTRLRQAERSPTARLHLIAMCRWVVARNEHVVVPEFNPFADTCAWRDCDTAIGERTVGPFCRVHMHAFYVP
jgi:hypothetical protein